MPGWFSLIGSVLPYLAPIVTAALPALTTKKDARADPVVNQQIDELQAAVKSADAQIKALAKALEQAMEANDKVLAKCRLISLVSLGIAVLSLALAIIGRLP